MKKTILVIDDSEDIQIIMNIALSNAGYFVISSYFGEEGIAKAEANKPDLIILDWHLPDITGLEVCRILKQNVNTKHIPIIILTGYRNTESNVVVGLEMGADKLGEKDLSTFGR